MEPTRRAASRGEASSHLTRRGLLAVSAFGLAAGGVRPLAAAPTGDLTIAAHASLAPTWFDPAETSGIITPYMLMYAMHDAVAKDLPDRALTPCLAESWTTSRDGANG